jgi:putative hemolysin
MRHRRQPPNLPESVAGLFSQNKLLTPVNIALQQVMMLDRVVQFYQQALAHPDGRPFFESLLSLLNINPQITREDLARIPRSGTVVAVANHPFGFVEGGVLGALLPTIRRDVKIMANSLLVTMFPAIQNHFISVDPFGGDEATKANQKGMRQALAHLKNGGMLVVFPAGEVAHVDLRKGAITDPEWSVTIARLVRMTRASVLPMYFSGTNSAPFHVLGLLHPKLRTMMLPYEFFNKQDRDLELRIGSLIPAKKLSAMNDDSEMMKYLRRRTYFLQHRETGKNGRMKQNEPEPVAAAVDPEFLSAEIERLPEERKLTEVGTCAVYYATAHEIPNVLREIGRLREITFRAAGEGTGKSIDLDSYDAYYFQLFIWNRETREIAGAYRVGPTDTITERFGEEGLYTSTLFVFKNRFLDKIGTALELGRSFVRIEYQRSFTPLLLLWRGIGAYVARNPQYKVLFGPVSISNDYLPVSRQLMVTYFNQHSRMEELTSFVKARSPFRQRTFKQWDGESGSMRQWDIEDLSALVADIETDQKGVPVLLRQYLKLGGRLLGFNVDRSFADALDGLIVVDLTRTDAKMLSRYLGPEGSANFLQCHSKAERAARIWKA